jgi:hypothetical protein
MKIQHIPAFGALAALTFALPACDDFLDLTPMNEVVKENFWTEKADVESSVYGCYSALESDDCLKRMFIWGEVRSDNVTTSSSTPWSLQQILKENLLESNGWVTWQCFYQVINRCNTVLTYAPQVAQIDPNYTESELRATVAEVTALRALCYFYLIRTFRDVPYVTTPSADDSDIEGHYRVAPTDFKTVLEALIADLEAVKGDALRLYPEETTTGDAANTSRITTCAIYALLADLYLWDGQYQEAARYCDLVFDYKRERYEELFSDLEAEDIYLWRDLYPLIQEQPSGTTAGNAYNAIFGTGNSFESIFELYFLRNQSTQNLLVNDYFGSNSSPMGSLAATSDLYNGVYEGNNALFQPTDCRVYEGVEQRSSSYAIRKYVRSTCSFIPSKNNSAPTASSVSYRGNAYANWIVYRLTDVMLIKAEAEIELAGEGVSASDNLSDAFALISTVYSRGNNFTTASADTLKQADYPSVSDMRDLLFNERRRELMFEGKRWFDLVRLSLRTGSNDKLIELVTAKQKENVSAIKIKLHATDALFFPYAKRELDANPKLTQNPAYITNETSSKN